jgi:voltage-gated potassium channel
MVSFLTGSRLERWFNRRMRRKGLDLRFAAYTILWSWTVGVLIFGVVEFSVDRQEFKTVWLALWWAVQTVTTVGYGDFVPSNTGGKIVGAALMLGGLSLYAVITALITSAFVSRTKVAEADAHEDSVARQVAKISRQLDAITAELATLQKRDG